MVQQSDNERRRSDEMEEEYGVVSPDDLSRILREADKQREERKPGRPPTAATIPAEWIPPPIPFDTTTSEIGGMTVAAAHPVPSGNANIRDRLSKVASEMQPISAPIFVNRNQEEARGFFYPEPLDPEELPSAEEANKQGENMQQTQRQQRRRSSTTTEKAVHTNNQEQEIAFNPGWIDESSTPGAIAVKGINAPPSNDNSASSDLLFVPEPPGNHHHHHEDDETHSTVQLGDESSSDVASPPYYKPSTLGTPSLKLFRPGGTSINNSKLVSAKLVENDVGQSAVPVAPDGVMGPAGKEKKKRRWSKRSSPKGDAEYPTHIRLLLTGLLTVLLLILFITVFNMLEKSEESSSSSSLKGSSEDEEDATTLSAPHWLFQNLDGVPDSTLKALLDPSTPQYQAYEWMRQDPHLSMYPNWRKLQRFALVTFYFATSGPTDWTISEHWLDYEFSECHWSTKLDFASLMDLDANKAVADMLTHLRNNNGEATGGIHWEDLLHFAGQSNDHDHHGVNTDDQGHSHHVRRLIFADVVIDESHSFQVSKSPQETHNCSDSTTDGSIHCHNYCDDAGVYRRLWPYTNGLKGTLPPELFLLTKLEILGVCTNPDLGGTLPTEIGLLTDLQFLFAVDNAFTGSFPSEMGQLESLRLLSMDGQPLMTGSFPTELGRIGPESLFYMSMAKYPGMEGPLPSELGLLATDDKLQVLDFTAAGLTGTVPSEMATLSRLQVLNVASNPSLTGTVPTELGLLNDLKLLNLRWNALSGSIPTQLAQLKAAFFLGLSGNVLQGTIPDAIYKDMPQLIGLRLENNHLTGVIATEIGLLLRDDGKNISSSLETLFLSHNLLEGSLPSQLGRLTNLETLNVGFNPLLRGTLPEELAKLDRLVYMDVQSTNIHGNLSAFVDGWSDLETLALADTMISGSIPSNFCNVADFVCSDILCGCHSHCLCSV